ncbi:hypothetical protein D3C80_1907880 [compost metagenome]
MTCNPEPENASRQPAVVHWVGLPATRRLTVAGVATASWTTALPLVPVVKEA